MILPRSTGLLFCLRTLLPVTPDLALYDITIGYPGVPPAGYVAHLFRKTDLANPLRSYAQSYYTLSSIYSGDGAPPTVHMHLRSFDLAQVPIGIVDAALSPDEADEAVTADERKAFDVWTRERWTEKDELLDEFYKAGEFPAEEGQRVEIPIGLRGFDDYVRFACVRWLVWCLLTSPAAARRRFQLCRSLRGLEAHEMGDGFVLFFVVPPSRSPASRNLVSSLICNSALLYLWHSQQRLLHKLLGHPHQTPQSSAGSSSDHPADLVLHQQLHNHLSRSADSILLAFVSSRRSAKFNRERLTCLSPDAAPPSDSFTASLQRKFPQPPPSSLKGRTYLIARPISLLWNDPPYLLATVPPSPPDVELLSACIAAAAPIALALIPFPSPEGRTSLVMRRLHLLLIHLVVIVILVLIDERIAWEKSPESPPASSGSIHLTALPWLGSPRRPCRLAFRS